jgi:hypothetical protein
MDEDRGGEGRGFTTTTAALHLWVNRDGHVETPTDRVEPDRIETDVGE